MKFWIEPLTDAAGERYWILFEHGQFHAPTAVISDSNMQGIANAVNGPKPTVNALAERVKAYRERNRYTQLELAALAGISRNYLSQIERGLVDNLSVDILYRLESVIGRKP